MSTGGLVLPDVSPCTLKEKRQAGDALTLTVGWESWRNSLEAGDFPHDDESRLNGLTGPRMRDFSLLNSFREYAPSVYVDLAKTTKLKLVR